jgi:hypothetical protein
MSSDWCRYAKPEETRLRTNSNVDANAVIAIIVGKVREVDPWDVVHTPDTDTYNRSHSDITGPEESHPRARIEFARAARVVLPLPLSD